MAEKEEAPREPHTYRRNTHSKRGHSGQNRLYNQLGVKDLRELLDRKRSERGQNGPNIPPPDPSYNYLKDPLRESEGDSLQEHPTRPNYTRKYYNKNNVSNNMKRDKEPYSGNAPSHSKNQDIENPMNIKIEFSTSTGEHVYRMDETTILPTIKHIPDRLPPQNRSFRGRGRGRGRGQQRTYQTRTIRSNNLDKRPPRISVSEDNQGQTQNLPPVVHNTEENWDDDLNENKNVAVDNEYFEQDVDDEFHEEQPDDIVGDEDHDNLEAGIHNLKLDESQQQNESTDANENNENSSKKN